MFLDHAIDQYVFAHVVNNLFFEKKSMCIIVFDLIMNFKANGSIFVSFFNFEKRRIILKKMKII